MEKLLMSGRMLRRGRRHKMQANGKSSLGARATGVAGELTMSLTP